MAPPRKNQFWKLRTSHGRDRIFESPEVLQAACYEYFEACERKPLKEQKVFGTGKRMTVSRMRAFTLNGLYIFLGINRQTWENYRKHDDFLAIIQEVETIIYDQKFTGAAAGMLKENIIARELGLADKTDHRFEDMPEEMLDQIIHEVKTKFQNGTEQKD